MRHYSSEDRAILRNSYNVLLRSLVTTRKEQSSIQAVLWLLDDLEATLEERSILSAAMYGIHEAAGNALESTP